MEQQPTGYSAPPSETDATMLNNSGSSSATPVWAPKKKQRATPVAPALVATFDNVNLHNASQIYVSSGSEILSVSSSSERQRRADRAKAKRELAERGPDPTGPSRRLPNRLSWTPSRRQELRGEPRPGHDPDRALTWPLLSSSWKKKKEYSKQ